MKKISLVFVSLILCASTCFALVDTDYIKSGQNKEDNYLPNAVNNNGKIMKWNKNVLYVYIEPCNSTKQKAVLSALYLYNNSFWGILQFKEVKNKDKADIAISFSKDIAYKGSVSGESAGVTKYTHDADNHLIRATITLSDKHLNTPAQIKQVTLHELGHAIGIAGHSLNSNDVMYPTTEGRGTLSRRDIETIKMIYKGKTNDIRRTLVNYEDKKAEMSLEVLLRDTEGAPDKYIVWINLGDFYYNNKKYNKALEAYQTALMKPNAPESKINKRISYCYTGLGNTRMAERYMKASEK